jgi:hypothetical protein
MPPNPTSYTDMPGQPRLGGGGTPVGLQQEGTGACGHSPNKALGAAHLPPIPSTNSNQSQQGQSFLHSRPHPDRLPAIRAMHPSPGKP